MMNTIDKNRIADFCESESALVPCDVWLRVEVRGVLWVGNLTPHLLGLAGSLSTLGWLSTQLPHFQETRQTRNFAQHWLVQCAGFCPSCTLQSCNTLSETWSVALCFSGSEKQAVRKCWTWSRLVALLISSCIPQQTNITQQLWNGQNWAWAFRKCASENWSNFQRRQRSATDTGRMESQELTLLSVAGAEPVTFNW